MCEDLYTLTCAVIDHSINTFFLLSNSSLEIKNGNLNGGFVGLGLN